MSAAQDAYLRLRYGTGFGNIRLEHAKWNAVAIRAGAEWRMGADRRVCPQPFYDRPPRPGDWRKEGNECASEKEEVQMARKSPRLRTCS